MTIASPIGRISLIGDAFAVRRVTLHPRAATSGPSPTSGIDEYQGPAALVPEALAEAAAELGEYFSGDRQQFTVRVVAEGTPFQQLVWQHLSEVPWGATLSYRELAEATGRPSAVRAVASAVAANPTPILCPCHRVLPSTGRLGNYSAGDGPETKWDLLVREGVNVPR